jgi:hypothetical protein
MISAQVVAGTYMTFASQLLHVGPYSGRDQANVHLKISSHPCEVGLGVGLALGLLLAASFGRFPAGQRR